MGRTPWITYMAMTIASTILVAVWAADDNLIQGVLVTVLLGIAVLTAGALVAIGISRPGPTHRRALAWGAVGVAAVAMALTTTTAFAVYAASADARRFEAELRTHPLEIIPPGFSITSEWSGHATLTYGPNADDGSEDPIAVHRQELSPTATAPPYDVRAWFLRRPQLRRYDLKPVVGPDWTLTTSRPRRLDHGHTLWVRVQADERPEGRAAGGVRDVRPRIVIQQYVCAPDTACR